MLLQIWSTIVFKVKCTSQAFNEVEQENSPDSPPHPTSPTVVSKDEYKVRLFLQGLFFPLLVIQRTAVKSEQLRTASSTHQQQLTIIKLGRTCFPLLTLL